MISLTFWFQALEIVNCLEIWVENAPEEEGSFSTNV
jgi:hypothetical protein